VPWGATEYTCGYTRVIHFPLVAPQFRPSLLLHPRRALRMYTASHAPTPSNYQRWPPMPLPPCHSPFFGNNCTAAACGCTYWKGMFSTPTSRLCWPTLTLPHRFQHAVHVLPDHSPIILYGPPGRSAVTVGGTGNLLPCRAGVCACTLEIDPERSGHPLFCLLFNMPT
jgi:hypothetical protein